MRPIFIHGAASITAQETIDDTYFFESIREYTSNPVPAFEPDYKELIPPLQLRRMNRSMRMALFTSKRALQHAEIPSVDAIILGSGMGCLVDSERFVEALLEDEEQRFNPTPFIQSTHNMAAATLALAFQCKGYNMTYVNNANSVASAVLDGMLYLSEHPEEVILLGGVEELGLKSPQFWEWAGFSEQKFPALPPQIQTTREMVSEGAGILVASAQARAHNLAVIKAIEYFAEGGDSESRIQAFMHANGVNPSEVDVLMLGIQTRTPEEQTLINMSTRLFPTAAQVGFKHLFGEHDSVSASAIAMACKLFEHQTIPPTLLLSDQQPLRIKNILLYNQRRGAQHSLYWMSHEF